MDAAWAAAGLVSGLLLLLSVPWQVAFRLHGIEAFGGQFSVRWLLGGLRFRIDLPRSASPKAEAAGPPPGRAPAPPRRRGARVRGAAALRQPAFRRRLLRLLGDALRAAHLRDLALHLRLGLGDPADTGLLWALAGPLQAAAGRLHGARISLEPDFAEAAFEFDARGRMTVVPLRFLALVVAFALSPATLRAWRSTRMDHA